jgi:hypothetical protein
MYRKGFYISVSLASIFAVILTAFIANPVIPQKVHYALRSNSGTNISPDDLSDSQKIYGIHQEVQGQKPQQDSVALFKDFYSKDVDEAFVRLLTEGKMKQRPINIQPVAPSEFYAVNRFRLDNGKDVVVYTQVPLTQVSTRESF